ncbi:hypothetical protein [Hyphococcus sp. DH-69]|uniref:hypothetical protein n=1 Tax=Hyphococcus formosus TaxID=3143534 RepID=UPI00398AAF64
MAFGNQQQATAQISSSRLANVIGAPANEALDAEIAKPAPRVGVQPDLSRIKTRRREETPEQRKRRMASNRLNFGATIIARLVIIAALGNFGYEVYEMTGTVHRGVAAGVIAISLDLLRVTAKAADAFSS